MDVNARHETTDRTGGGPERRAGEWGPGRVWLAWGIYFTVLILVALATLAGS
jgi:hypothetical protein